MKSCSTMVDDHTPVELSLVIGSRNRAALRIYVEPLSPSDGSPAERATWLQSLKRLGTTSRAVHNDLSWSETCMEALTIDIPSGHPLNCVGGRTQFAFGMLRVYGWQAAN
jgi:hypothetical protein